MIYLSAMVVSMFTTIALIPILKDLAGKYLAIDCAHLENRQMTGECRQCDAGA